jgi:menaquinone-dependent protoporphyrinogen oxidase
MKTAIIYASKYGTTEKCANLLNEAFNGQAEVINAKNLKGFDLSKYDTVLIGGSFYIGHIRKEIADFLIRYHDQLLSKKIGLFVVGMPQNGDYMTEYNLNFPDDLRNKAVATGYFGYELNVGKMKFLEKFIMKKMAKITADQSNILVENIEKFAKAFK